MNLFICSRIEENRSGQTELILDSQETHHALRVLRIREGESVYVTDGAGTIYIGRLLNTEGGEEARVLADSQVYHAPEEMDLWIAIGMIKKRDRLEFAIEKGVELGISRFLIYVGDHSEKRRIRFDRLESTAMSAMKQCFRAWRPDVQICSSVQAVLDVSDGRQLLVADETAESQMAAIPEMWSNEPKLLVFIGAEGGFSDEERSLLYRSGAESLTLGRYRLRTETAVVASAVRLLQSKH